MSVLIAFIYILFCTIKSFIRKKKKGFHYHFHLNHSLFATWSDTPSPFFWLLYFFASSFLGQRGHCLVWGGTWCSSYSIPSHDQPCDLACDSTICRCVRRYRIIIACPHPPCHLHWIIQCSIVRPIQCDTICIFVQFLIFIPMTAWWVGIATHVSLSCHSPVTMINAWGGSNWWWLAKIDCTT